MSRVRLLGFLALLAVAVYTATAGDDSGGSAGRGEKAVGRVTRVVDGDTVWTRATSNGINRETGERSVVTWLIVQRVVEGRITEQWVATFPGVDWTA